MSLNDWTAAEVARTLGGSGRSAPKQSGKGWSICCPAHDDRKPSLSLNDGQNGTLLYYCFGGCSQEDVKAALEHKLGIDTSAPMPANERPKKKKIAAAAVEDEIEVVMPIPEGKVSGEPADFHHPGLGRPSRVWQYQVADGQVAGYITRYETTAGDKEIIPWCWTRERSTGRERLRQKAMPAPRPLYNLVEIMERPADPIVWNEGEKAADAAKVLFPGWVSTTIAGGGKALGKADLSPLYGRIVVVLCDHDAPGYQTGAQLADLLLGKSDLRQIIWPQRWPDKVPYALKKGDDAADHLEAGWNADLLREMVRQGWPLQVPLREIAEPFDVIEYDQQSEQRFARR